MSVLIDIRDGLVLGKSSQVEAVNYFVSERTGIETASFSVGVREYDDSYDKNTRYNNFYVTVPPEMVDRVKRMKIRKNSLVHILATLDFDKSVLSPREQQGDPTAKDYGKSRSVNGLKLKLLSIDYAGASSGAGTTKNEKEEGETERERTITTLPSNNETHDSNTKQTLQETVDTTNTAASKTVSSDSLPTVEEELNVPITDLDVEDIFSSRREHRRFF